MTTYATVEDALAELVETRTGEYLVLHVKAGWYEWLTGLDLDELDSYGYDDEYELIELENLTVVYASSSDNVPAHVSTQDWDDPDNG